MTPGITARIAPATPDLAGNPTEKAHSPLKLYIPHEYIRERQFFTASGENTFLKA
jgi:hypothetical protein